MDVPVLEFEGQLLQSGVCPVVLNVLGGQFGTWHAISVAKPERAPETPPVAAAVVFPPEQSVQASAVAFHHVFSLQSQAHNRRTEFTSGSESIPHVEGNLALPNM